MSSYIKETHLYVNGKNVLIPPILRSLKRFWIYRLLACICSLVHLFWLPYKVILLIKLCIGLINPEKHSLLIISRMTSPKKVHPSHGLVCVLCCDESHISNESNMLNTYFFLSSNNTITIFITITTGSGKTSEKTVLNMSIGVFKKINLIKRTN